MANCNNVRNINYLDHTKVTGLTKVVGDLITYDGTNNQLEILSKGTNGQFLRVDTTTDTDLAWAGITGGDVTLGPFTQGDVVYVDASGNLTVDNTGSVNNFAYTPTDRALEFGCWVIDINASPKQGVCLGSITGQTAVGTSIALGNGSSVAADDQLALGSGTVSTGAAASMAIGDGASVLGTTNGAANAIAIGTGASVTDASASAANAIALGNGATTSAADAISLGLNAAASGVDSIALGSDAIASGATSVAIGENADATGARAVAIGVGALAACADSVGLAGPITTRNSEAVASGTERLQKFSGAKVTFATEDISLVTAGPVSAQINLPSGCRFYPTKVTLIRVIAGTGAGNTDDIEIGENGNTTKYLSITNYKSTQSQYVLTSYSGFDSREGTTTPLVTRVAGGVANAGSMRDVWEGTVVED